MKAQYHPFEPARLAALRAYDVLDTPRESDFDDIVMLASRICEPPIAVINLIDETRQWFKAETGLGVRETPLDTSLCAHVILQEDFVEIPDTLADASMRDNPLCLADPGLRFYAGYLDEVVRLIDSTLAADVSVQGSFENMAVGSREASIVATIVNELAAKASKHSFNRSSGTIILSGKRVADAGYRLVCSDDAEQREAEAIDPNRRVGLGLKILKASVCQLGETMTATGVNEGYSTWLHFYLSAGCPMAAFRQQHFSPGRSGARHEARHARA